MQRFKSRHSHANFKSLGRFCSCYFVSLIFLRFFFLHVSSEAEQSDDKTEEKSVLFVHSHVDIMCEYIEWIQWIENEKKKIKRFFFHLFFLFASLTFNDNTINW